MPFRNDLHKNRPHSERFQNIFFMYLFLHLAEGTKVTYQQQRASYTANQTACATKHAAVAAARGQDLRIRSRLKHEIKQWLCVSGCQQSKSTPT